MADLKYDKTYDKPIAIEQTHPIVCQAWHPPYKPAALPLQNSWKHVMSEANATASDPKARGGGGADPRGSDFFYTPPPGGSPRSGQPHLPGGSNWTPGKSGGGGGSFNVFSYAGAAGGGGGGGGGGYAGLNTTNTTMLLPTGLKQRPNLSMLDEADEYDERVDAMRHGIAGGSGRFGTGSSRRKTKAQREQAREDYRRQQEAAAQQGGGGQGGGGGGYGSDGEVDEGCVAAMGEDDDVRDLRMKFTPVESRHDGTQHTAYASAVHKKRTGTTLRTPNSAASNDGSGGKFIAAGLRTPQFDATSNMPTPVQRFQRRQQHHLLRQLGGSGTAGSGGGGDGGGAAGGSSVPLFSPHAIPSTEDEDAKRKNKFDEPSLWMFGRDESVEDVMRKHFLEPKQQQQQQQQGGQGGVTPAEQVRTVSLRQ